MRRIMLFFTFIMLSFFSKAQETKMILDYSTHFKTTEISVKNFVIKKAETAYELAVNLSYFHHISHNYSDEYLILPIVTINSRPLEEISLKEITISEIYEYQFKSGNETQALYGTRAKYGLLNIVLQKDKFKGKNKE